MAFAQNFQILRFIVGSSSLPTFPQDSDPDESQRAHDGPMAFASFSLLLVIGLGPGAETCSLAGPLDKSLA